MKVGDVIILVTEQFADGRGIGAMSVVDGRIVVRRQTAETRAVVLAIYEDGSYRVLLDDNQEWVIKDGSVLSREP